MAGGEKAIAMKLNEALTNQVSWKSFKKRRTPRPTLLVVDDDVAVCALLRDVLTNWGYAVVSAANGQEGLQVLTAFVVDGIILDIHMPVMSGERMLDELRWLGYQIPVLMISGGSDEPMLRQLMTTGAQGFMTKPFSLPSLHDLCTRVFEHHGVGVVSGDHPQMA